jgi:uncharacterized GH25 family protein
MKTFGRPSRLALLISIGSLFSLTTANAHEFLIKPAQFYIDSGAKVPFSIMATHYFVVSEEVEPIDTVKAWVVENEQITPVEVKENHILETLDGVARLNRKGTAFLVGHLQEPIESVKSEGSNRSQKIKREKFAKALITVSAETDSYKKALGHKLEIVPVSSLTKARAGDELSFKILLDGKPMKGQVYATYDGFSRRYMTFAQAMETLEDGFAYVKITGPGTWMVRVEKRLESNTAEYDILSLKATLVFSVQ